jgi:hypothetical protein
MTDLDDATRFWIGVGVALALSAALWVIGYEVLNWLM